MLRLAFLFALTVTAAQAQPVATSPVDDGIDRYAWLSGTVGPSLTGGAGGGTFTATAGRNDNLISFRASVTDTGGSGPITETTAVLVRDLGLLYGRSLVRGPRGVVAASAGLAYTIVDLDIPSEFGDVTFETRRTVGVPFQVDAVGFLGPLGLGARLGGNLNAEGSTLTAQVGLYIGGSQ